VLPDTVVQWHRSGFALYWRLISRFPGRAGRKRISKEIRDLIFWMVAENATWGAPRIHGELLMLGFDVSERTISRWMRKAPRDPKPAKRWLAFVRNHREAIAAMDFFTVPTIFGVLYCFFVIGHDRRRILHFNITRHPTSLWVVQQLREAFPYESAPRFLIFDRDAKYGTEIPAAIRSMKIKRIRTSFESPWQNGIAERWVQSCRRDLLNHVIPLNEGTSCGYFPTMSTIIMRIARILHSGRKRRSADLTPIVQALFFLVPDLAGCIIVTIELLNPHQCSIGPRREVPPSLYLCAARAGVPLRRKFRPVVPSRSSLQAVVSANRPISGADRVLAKPRAALIFASR